MQINSYQSIQAMPTTVTKNAPTQSVNPSQATVEPGIQVSVSAQAQKLAETDTNPVKITSRQPVQLPVEPQKPLTGEKLEQAVQFKKAQTQYQVASDMLNILNKDNSSNMSASSAYYLSKNEEARELVVDTKSQQQAMKNMQAYQEQTATLNEQYAVN